MGGVIEYASNAAVLQHCLAELCPANAAIVVHKALPQLQRQAPLQPSPGPGVGLQALLRNGISIHHEDAASGELSRNGRLEASHSESQHLPPSVAVLPFHTQCPLSVPRIARWRSLLPTSGASRWLRETEVPPHASRRRRTPPTQVLSIPVANAQLRRRPPAHSRNIAAAWRRFITSGRGLRE